MNSVSKHIPNPLDEALLERLSIRMAIKLGWFALRATREATMAAIRAAAAEAPADAFPEQWGAANNDEWTCVSILGWQIAHVMDWARATCGHAEATIAMGFFVCEGTWGWSLFDSDRRVAAMEAFPHRYPRLLGDLARAARLLAVRETLLHAYCVGHPYDDVDEETATNGEIDRVLAALKRLETFRAFPTDNVPPWDEWCHADFARRLGIENGHEELFELDAPRRCPKKWKHQMEDLEVASVFDPAAWRRKNLSD